MKTYRHGNVPSFKTWRTEEVVQNNKSVYQVCPARTAQGCQATEKKRPNLSTLALLPHWLGLDLSPLAVCTNYGELSARSLPGNKSRVIFPDWVLFLATFPDDSLIFPGVYHFPDNPVFPVARHPDSVLFHAIILRGSYIIMSSCV